MVDKLLKIKVLKYFKLIILIFCWLAIALLYCYVSRRGLIQYNDFYSCFIQGCKMMSPALILFLFQWYKSNFKNKS